MRIMIHGLLLYLSNITGILAGFIVFKLIAGDQRAVQAPIAAVASIVFFIVWCYLWKKVSGKKLFCGALDLIFIFIMALIWNPVIFFPLHYFTQGYGSSWGNILVMILFQIPINILALFLVFSLFGQNKTSSCLR